MPKRRSNSPSISLSEGSSYERKFYSLTNPRQKVTKPTLPHGIDWRSTVDHPAILDNFLSQSGFKTSSSEDATPESHSEIQQPTSHTFDVKSVSGEDMAVTTPLASSKYAPASGAVNQGNKKENQLPVDMLPKTLRSSSLGKGTTPPPAKVGDAEVKALLGLLAKQLKISDNEVAIQNMTTAIKENLPETSEKAEAAIEQLQTQILKCDQAADAVETALKEALQQHDVDMKQIRDDISQHETQIKGVEAEIKANTKIMNETISQISMLQDRLDSVKSDLAENETSLKNLQATTQMQQAGIAEAEQKMSSSKSTASEHVESMLRIKKHCQSQLELMKTHLNDLKLKAADDLAKVKSEDVNGVSLSDKAQSPLPAIATTVSGSYQAQPEIDDEDDELEEVTMESHGQEVTVRRKVKLDNLPGNTDSTELFAILHSGTIQEVIWTAGQPNAEAIFLMQEDCLKFVQAHPNGILWPLDKNHVIGVTICEDLESRLPATADVIDNKCTRVVRATVLDPTKDNIQGVDQRMQDLAKGRSLPHGFERRFEAILKSKLGSPKIIYQWRFFSIKDAISMKKLLDDHYSWLQAGFAPDPCAKRDGPVMDSAKKAVAPVKK